MPRFNKMRQADAALCLQDQPEKCRFGAAPLNANLELHGTPIDLVKASVDAFNRGDVVQHGGNLPVILLVYCSDDYIFVSTDSSIASAIICLSR
jgi:hypothetical protein